MFISNLKIRNFRAIENLELNLNNGLNVIIGENNSGKSTIIDLLHLVFEEGNYPRKTHWKETDFRINDGESEPIEFDIRFTIDNQNELAWFNKLHVPIINDAGDYEHCLEIHGQIKLIKIKSDKKIKRSFWGGKDPENKIPWEVLNALNCIYLGPLRDINQDLRPNKTNLLSNLFLNMAELKGEDYKSNMSEIFKRNFKSEKWNELIEDGQEKINYHLNEMNITNTVDNIKIDFSFFEYEDIIKKLLLQIPFNSDLQSNQIYLNLYQNGLGYNNLIYTATLFGDILQRNEIFEQNYNLLLIEEPESHLHPQLESTFFRYLDYLNENKDFQLIVTSHSPIITAKTDLDNLIILNNLNSSIEATSIKNIPLSDENKIFLKKFLDVTKSQLFFAKGVILVEGITEALLLPTFAKLIDNKYDLEKRGVEIIVTGTSFSHYAKLFNSDDENQRLKFRCAILTDDDSHKPKANPNRIKNLDKLKGNNLDLFVGTKTLEYEIYNSNLDNGIIETVFDKVHERIRKQLDVPFTPDILVEKLESNNTKSDFAFKLANYLDKEILKNPDYNEFNVPKYIEDAIKFVMGD